VKWVRAFFWAASAIFALAGPLFLDRGMLNDLWNLALAVILASAWNLLGGFAGQVSLGYSAFLGIGAYTTVLLSLRGVDPFLTLPLGAIVAVVFSLIIGLPAFRLRGPYFTIATIGVAEAVRVCATSVSFTGGSSGLRMPPGSFNFNLNYFSMVVLAILVVALAAYVKRSAFGRALAAIKQDIDAAEAVGVNSSTSRPAPSSTFA
jgi:branched-chain amino acid transport system permease protein